MNRPYVPSNLKPETGAFFPRDRDWHPPAFTPGYKTSILRSPRRAARRARQHALRDHRAGLRP